MLHVLFTSIANNVNSKTKGTGTVAKNREPCVSLTFTTFSGPNINVNSHSTRRAK